MGLLATQLSEKQHISDSSKSGNSPACKHHRGKHTHTNASLCARTIKLCGVRCKSQVFLHKKGSRKDGVPPHLVKFSNKFRHEGDCRRIKDVHIFHQNWDTHTACCPQRGAPTQHPTTSVSPSNVSQGMELPPQRTHTCFGVH